MKKINCLRCDVRMGYQGSFKFHEGARIGVFGDLFEIFQNRERFILYVCPDCGKVEFFLPDADFFHLRPTFYNLLSIYFLF